MYYCVMRMYENDKGKIDTLCVFSGSKKDCKDNINAREDKENLVLVHESDVNTVLEDFCKRKKVYKGKIVDDWMKIGDWNAREELWDALMLEEIERKEDLLKMMYTEDEVIWYMAFREAVEYYWNTGILNCVKYGASKDDVASDLFFECVRRGVIDKFDETQSKSRKEYASSCVRNMAGSMSKTKKWKVEKENFSTEYLLEEENNYIDQMFYRMWDNDDMIDWDYVMGNVSNFQKAKYHLITDESFLLNERNLIKFLIWYVENLDVVYVDNKKEDNRNIRKALRDRDKIASYFVNDKGVSASRDQINYLLKGIVSVIEDSLKK